MHEMGAEGYGNVGLSERQDPAVGTAYGMYAAYGRIFVCHRIRSGILYADSGFLGSDSGRLAGIWIL